MSIVEVVLVLIVVGVLLSLLQRSVPIDPTVRSLIALVIFLALVIWLFRGLPSGAWRVCETRAVYNLPRAG